MSLFNSFTHNLLTHPKMELIFLDEVCDMFMNESEIRLEEGIEGERPKEIPSS
jgi:hypothetical protein